VATYFWGPEKRLIVPTPDLAFLMHDDDSGRCQMHQVGIPEKPIIDWAGQTFGDKEKLFIDCGAHMGAYSILLSDKFKEIHSFEAQRRTYFQLCGNIFINEKTNITPYNKAVTDPANANQKTTLSIVSEDGGGSTIRKPAPFQTVLTEEKVETVTLDHYHFENVGLIKLDIEGNELKALQGARYTLMRNNFPPLIFEANNDPWFEVDKKELFHFLHAMRYEVGEIRPFDNMYFAKFSEPRAFPAQ
jgi:FkbM family methyltransferase